VSYGVCNCVCGPPVGGVCNGCGMPGAGYGLPPIIPAAPHFGQSGWACPKCHRVYSPLTLECRACNLAIEIEAGGAS
jgi:hypothetical protein